MNWHRFRRPPDTVRTDRDWDPARFYCCFKTRRDQLTTRRVGAGAAGRHQAARDLTDRAVGGDGAHRTGVDAPAVALERLADPCLAHSADAERLRARAREALGREAGGAPEAESGDWQDLNLPLLTAALKTATGNQELIPLHVLRLLRSLAQDHDSETQLRSSFELRQISQDFLKLRIRGGYNWRGIQGLGERRRALAAVVLPFLIGKLPPGSRSKDLLVDTTFGELMDLIDQDLDLRSRIPESQRRKAIELVLLYL